MRIKYISAPGELSVEDAHTLRVLQQQSFEHVYTRLDMMYEAHWWIAYDGAVPIGLCSMTAIDVCTMSLAGVNRGYRGQGIQRKMIRKREALAKKLGLPLIVTYVAYNNIWSVNNLIKTGYTFYIPEEEWGLPYSYYLLKRLPS